MFIITRKFINVNIGQIFLEERLKINTLTQGILCFIMYILFWCGMLKSKKAAMKGDIKWQKLSF